MIYGKNFEKNQAGEKRHYQQIAEKLKLELIIKQKNIIIIKRYLVHDSYNK